MKSVKGFTPAGQFGMLILFLGVGILLAALVQFGIGMTMVPAGTSIEKMGEVMLAEMMKPENLSMARLSQVFGTLFMFCMPVFLYLWVCWGNNPFWLGFNRQVNIYQVLIGFAIIFCANVAASPLEDISKSILVNFPRLDALALKMETAYMEQVMMLSNLKSWPEFIMAIFIMAFFPALFEELFFRGAIQSILVRWWRNPWIAIFVTSVIFSIIHFSIYLFLSRIVLGLALGIMFYQTKNIWVNTIAHFLNNLVAVIQLFYMGMNNKKIDPATMEPSFHWAWSILALAGLVFFFLLLEKYSKQNRAIIQTKENLLMQAQNPFHDIAAS
ncbi:MAG: CPBP family intramembrane glutamic endopeptidase [Ferruginibacter sp.]